MSLFGDTGRSHGLGRVSRNSSSSSSSSSKGKGKVKGGKKKKSRRDGSRSPSEQPPGSDGSGGGGSRSRSSGAEADLNLLPIDLQVGDWLRMQGHEGMGWGALGHVVDVAPGPPDADTGVFLGQG